MGKLYSKEEETQIQSNTKFTIGKLVSGIYQVKTILYSVLLPLLKKDIQSFTVIDYDDLLQLADDDALEEGREYKIPNATTAEIILIVKATSSNSIDTSVRSPDFPKDIIKYDFENDVITWRWNTIDDISAAEDVRNLTTITIGSGCQHIHLDRGVTGSIGVNCTNIEVGVDSEITILEASKNIKIGRDSTVNIKGSNIEIGNECEISATNMTVSSLRIGDLVNINITSSGGFTSLTSCVFYNNSGLSSTDGILDLTGDIYNTTFHNSVEVQEGGNNIYTEQREGATTVVIRDTNFEKTLFYSNGSMLIFLNAEN